MNGIYKGKPVTILNINVGYAEFITMPIVMGATIQYSIGGVEWEEEITKEDINQLKFN